MLTESVLRKGTDNSCSSNEELMKGCSLECLEFGVHG